MGMLSDQVNEMLQAVTKDWTKAKRKQLREKHALIQLREVRTELQPPFLEAAKDIITRAYLQVSDGGRLYAMCRQLYYECREQFRQACGNMPTDNYFRSLLRTVMQPDWKVAFDPRGNLVEPHTGVRIPLACIAHHAPNEKAFTHV